MGAQNNLSNELFFPVRRGIYLKPNAAHTYSEKNVGVHWSANNYTAEGFAKRRGFKGSKRVILHGKIPMSSVETDPKVYKQKDADPVKYRGESEVLAKEGSTVFLTGRTSFRGYNTVKSRTRNYNPPREAKA